MPDQSFSQGERRPRISLVGQDSNLVILYFDGLSHDKIGILSHDRREVRQPPQSQGDRKVVQTQIELARPGWWMLRVR